MKKCFFIFGALFVLIASVIVALSLQPITMSPVNPKIKQVEIKRKGDLLNSTGSLIDYGYSRSPVKIFNQDQIAAPLNLPFLTSLRLKKWEFYQVVLPQELIFQITVADLGYSGNLALHMYEIKQQKFSQVDQIITPFNMPNLPNSTALFKGKISVKSDKLSVSYHSFEFDKDNYKVNIKVDCPYLNVTAEYSMIKPKSDEEIVMLTPLNQDATHFYYNVKTYNMKVEGFVNTGQSYYRLKKAQGGRDWGRGVWNYNTYWLWMTAQGYLNKGEQFGLNLGRGFEESELAAAYEDCAFVNGKLNKLNTVYYNIPNEKFQNWTFYTKTTTEKGSINGVFKPLEYYDKDHNFLLIKSKISQAYGIYNGWFINEQSQNITFSDVYGSLEQNYAKW